jgi:acyl carrier protein
MQKVIDIVAQLTGYPADLLDPDLDLEADLGVDTVKQAEVFAAVREHYDVERDDSLKLRDFPTIKHVAGWVRSQGRPGSTCGGSRCRSSGHTRSHTRGPGSTRLPRSSRAASRPSTRCRGGSRSPWCGPTWRQCVADRRRARRVPASSSCSTKAASARPWSSGWPRPAPPR